MNEPRIHVNRGSVYVIRDVRPRECEFAVLTEYGLQWRPCPEGAGLGDIEPFGLVTSNDENPCRQIEMPA